MTTRLELYNNALGHLGPTRLANLTENRPDRFELDAAYPRVERSMLARGLWYHSLRTVEWTPDTDIEPNFGLPYVYNEPEDFVRLRLISPVEDQSVEDLSFRHEGGYFFSVHPVLYVTYVSDDESYGLNLGAYPELYSEAFGAELAYVSGLPITKDKGTKNDLLVIKKRLLNEAKRVNAVDERVKGKPVSSWVRNRLAGSRSNDQRRAGTV